MSKSCSRMFSLVALVACISATTSQIMDSCSSEPCLRGGICFPLGADDFLCVCPMGVRGKTCNRAAEVTTNSVDRTSVASTMSVGLSVTAGRSRPTSTGGITVASNANTAPATEQAETSQTQRNLCLLMSEICFNGGTCVLQCEEDDCGTGCMCLPGFEGLRCEVTAPTTIVPTEAETSQKPTTGGTSTANNANTTPASSSLTSVTNQAQATGGTTTANNANATPASSPLTSVTNQAQATGGTPTANNENTTASSSPLTSVTNQTQGIVDSCSPNPCLANGDCIPLGTDFVCLCPLGFTGKTCDRGQTTMVPTDAETSPKQTTGGTPRTINVNTTVATSPSTSITNQTQGFVDSCSGNPCLVNGVCIPLGTEFVCLCPVGFTGKICDIAPTTIVPTDAETSQKQTARGTSTAIDTTTTAATTLMTSVRTQTQGRNLSTASSVTTLTSKAASMTSDATVTLRGTTLTANGTTATTTSITETANVTTATASGTIATSGGATAVRSNTTATTTSTVAITSGTTAITSGTSVPTSGATETAIGTTTSASGTTAISSSSTPTQGNTTTMSNGTTAMISDTTVITSRTSATGRSTTELASGTTATTTSITETANVTTAVASGTTATSSSATAVRSNTTATTTGTVAITSGTTAITSGTSVPTSGAIETANVTTAVASGTTATSGSTTAVRSNTTATTTGTVAITSGTTAITSGTSVPTSGATETAIGTTTSASGTAAISSSSTPTQGNTTTMSNGTTAMISDTTVITSRTSATGRSTTVLASGTTEMVNSTTGITSSTTAITGGTTAMASGTAVMANGTSASASSTTATANGTTTTASGTTLMINGTARTASGTAVMTNETTTIASGTTAMISQAPASSSVRPTVEISNPPDGLRCFECNGVSQCTAENIPLRSCPEGQMCFSANITIGSDPATSLPLIRRGCENIPTGQRGCVASRDILAMRPTFLPIQVSIDETSGRACLCDSNACNININQEDTDTLIVQLDTTGLSDEIILRWNVLGIESNVDGFYVEIQVSGGDEWITISPFLATDERVFTISGVQSASVSAVRVVAVDQSKHEVSKSLSVPIRRVESGTKVQEGRKRSVNVFGVATTLVISILLISAMATFWFKKRSDQNVPKRVSTSGPIVNGV